MKKFLTALFAVVFFVTAFSLPLPGRAAVSDWQQGAAIYPRWNADFESETFRQSLNDLAGTGANYVTLVIPLYQSNLYSTDINPGWNTPTDASLTAGIAYAKSLGLQVALKPHAESYDGQWRAHINPSDRAGWFSAYGNWLEHYARLAQASGAHQIMVGSELIDMASATSHPENTARWIELIDRVRGVFSGKLSYSANWGGSWWADEKNRIEFWSHLDYIGIAAYFALDSGGASVDELKGKWEYWRTADIEPLQRKWGKPVLFTEIGYRSMNGARFQPFNSWDEWGANEWEQAQLYEAMLSFWNNHSYMQGVHLWDWISDPNAGGSWTTSYTPQNKQAEQVLTNWWSGGGTPPEQPPGETSFTTSVSVSPAAPNAGEPLAATAFVTNGTSTANGIVVDIEISDETGTRLHQAYFENQSFQPGEARNYTAHWTPSAPGDYTVSVGVFGPGWTRMYVWDGDFQVSVSGGSPPPPPPPPVSSTIDIWWPTDGAAIYQTTPFKALLQNWMVENYEMFWQVDGDVLNPMYTSYEDWPHKEAWVDVSGWNWRADGPYRLDFVAKDASGTVIASKSSSIMVAR